VYALIAHFNRLCNGAFDAGLAPFAGLGEYAQVTVIALFVGVAVALVFNRVLDRTKLKRARRDLRSCLFEIWLYRHDPGVVLRAQWELMKANGRYVSAILPPLLIAMLAISPVLVQSYHRFGLDPVPDGATALLTVELGDGVAIDGFAEAVPELVWDGGRGTVTAMVRQPSANRVVWRLHPTKPGTHTLHIVRGGKSETFPLYVAPLKSESVIESRLARSWRLLAQPRGTVLGGDSGYRRISIDYPEADSGWLIWLTVTSLLAAVIVNRVGSAP
jgi:hypothetical protein